MSTKLTVVKSNHIVRASYELTLNEQRLILLCIAKVKRSDIDAQTVFEITVSEFADQFDLSITSSYKQLREATERLYERSVLINTPTAIEQIESEKKLESIKTRWVSNVRYLEGQGGVNIQFSPIIIPYISKLHSEFTIYNLKYIAKMSSNYSIRIYELLAQWISVGKLSISIEQLREILCLEYKYKAVKDFRARVIAPAVNEINATSDLDITYEPYKEGRSIKGFNFTLRRKSKPKVTKSYIEEHARVGESYAEAERRLKSKLNFS